MSDIGALVDYPLPLVNSIGILSSLYGATAQTFQNAAVWPSANLAVYIPFTIGYPTTFVKATWFNGATVGTNHVDVGIYDSQGNRLVNTGSTLTSGASQIQSASITPTKLEQGSYFLAMSMDGTTDTVFRSATPAAIISAWGLMNQATAFPLPTTASFSAPSFAQIPYFGITTNTTV